MFTKSLLSAIAAGGLTLAAGAANANVATYTTATAYNTFAGGGSIGISDPVDWGQFSTAQGNLTVNDSTVRDGASITTANGENVTATNAGSTPFTVYTNGATGGTGGMRWDGDFASGTNVLYTSGSSITLTFNGAITGFGIDAQTSSAGAYGFTIQAYNSSNTLLDTATASGYSMGRGTDDFGTAAFAGLTSTAGDISYVVITSTGPNTSAGFAIDTSLIYHFANNQTGSTGSATTPEPGTLALLGAGLAALGTVRRRRQRA